MSYRQPMISNPTRPLVLLPFLGLLAVLNWFFGNRGLEAAVFMLSGFILLLWGWVWDIHDRLQEIEKRRQPGGDQRSPESDEKGGA